MTLRVALTIAGDADGAKKAVKDTATAIGDLDRNASAAGRSAGAMTTGLLGAGAATPVFKLNQQQLVNMQFQLNDIATGLASGQSPFTVMTQQGLQLSQMFAGQRASLPQVFRAIGSGLLGFVTNPLNLAVVGAGALAAAIPAIWHAFTGSDAGDAEDTLSRFDDLLREIALSSEGAAKAARQVLKEGLSADELAVDARKTASDLRQEYEVELTKLGAFVGTIRSRMTEMISPDDIGFGDALSAGEIELANLYGQLQSGTIEAKRFREEMAGIILAENTDDDVRTLAQELYDASKDATGLERRLDAVAVAAAAMQRRLSAGFATVDMDANLRFRMDPDGYDRLREGLEGQQEEAAREAEQEARDAKRAERERQRIALQREANQQTISDLQAEIAAYGLTGDARDQALAQLREEQEIRQAIAALGPQATEAEIAALQTLIPLREAALEKARETEQAIRRGEQAAQDFATTLADGLLRGESATDALGDALGRLSSRLLDQGLNSLISTIFGAVVGGLGGGASSAAIANLAGAAGGALFDKGGDTGGSDPSRVAGLVHEREYVFDHVSTARIGVSNLEALRRGALKGFASGGYAGSPVASAVGAGAAADPGADRSIVEIRPSRDFVASILQQARQQSVRIAGDAIEGYDRTLPDRVLGVLDDPAAR